MEIKKRWFKIGEVARECGTSTSSIRFWEGEFGFPLHSRRIMYRGKSLRKFTANDIDRIARIVSANQTGMFTVKGLEMIARNKITVMINENGNKL